MFETIENKINHSLYEQNKRAWLRILLNELINLHTSVKILNRELKGLYYVKEEVRVIMDKQTEKIRAATLEILSKKPEEVHSDHLEITVILIVDFISSIVDQIVFSNDLSENEKEHIINMGTDAIFKILYQ